MSFTNWGPNEPNYGYEQCTVMDISNGKWGDAYCGDSYGVVCETEVVSYVNSFAENLN